jgi:hypothetical protein
MFDVDTRISKTHFTLGWPARYEIQLVDRAKCLTPFLARGMPLRFQERSVIPLL